MRKQRLRAEVSGKASSPAPKGPCVVCGIADGRALVEIDLAGEPCVTVCGSHELMHRRSGFSAQNAAELRAAFGDRRSNERRGGPGEIDELAEALTAAFTRDRRGPDRRAS